MRKGKVITILGPTASGKTALSVYLAKKFGSAVISGDAFQVYRGMDIGTAKVTEEEAAGVPHFLVDILSPEEPYSAARFCEMAAAVIEEEDRKGRIPIIAGGTGLYIQSLLEGYEFLPKGKGQKNEWKELYRREGKDALIRAIRERAPEVAVPPDPQRMLRLLELIEIGAATSAEKSGELVYDGPVIGLTMEREELYRRIELRVDLMMQAGLLEEVRKLLAAGIPEDAQSMRAIGYKELIPVIRDGADLAGAVSLIKKNTRHFAKRQLTWYRRMPYITWFTREAGEAADAFHQRIEDYAAQHLVE